MTSQQYIEKLQHIRNDINSLIDELWDIPENKHSFKHKTEFAEQVISDILNGYEKEN